MRAQTWKYVLKFNLPVYNLTFHSLLVSPSKFHFNSWFHEWEHMVVTNKDRAFLGSQILLWGDFCFFGFKLSKVLKLETKFINLEVQKGSQVWKLPAAVKFWLDPPWTASSLQVATGILSGERGRAAHWTTLSEKSLRGRGRSTCRQPSAPDPFFLIKNSKLQNHGNYF